MTLREAQSIFALNIAKLIIFANERGYQVVFEEAKRPIDMQLLYYYGYYIKRIADKISLVKTDQKSWTLSSYHLKKLAVDLSLFKDGRYLNKRGDHKEIAEYWITLNPKNECGHFWGKDENHYQMSR